MSTPGVHTQLQKDEIWGVVVICFSRKYQKYKGTFCQDEGVVGSPLPGNPKIPKVPENAKKNVNEIARSQEGFHLYGSTVYKAPSEYL